MQKKSCDQCHFENLTAKNILELETQQFCSAQCISSYSDEHYDTCYYCKLYVPGDAKIKFCLRFGTKVGQFCSLSCMNTFKKENSFCTLCQEPIHSFMLISEEEKFCSPFCVSRYNGRGINQLNFENENPCKVCNVTGVHHLEMLKDVQSIFFCSKSCVKKYNDIYKIIKYQCALCGCLIDSCILSFYLKNKFLPFCSCQCSSIYLTSECDIMYCTICKVKKFSFDLIRKQKNSEYYCSLLCLNQGQDPSEEPSNQTTNLSSRRSSVRTSNDSFTDLETDNENDESKNRQKIVSNVLNKCEMRDLLAKVIKSRFNATQEDKGCQTLPQTMMSESKWSQYSTDSFSKEIQTVETQNFIAIPFPVYIPQPLPQTQYQVTPFVIPVPVPVPVVIPLLKAKEDAVPKERKLTFNDVATQFILKALSKESECDSTGDTITSNLKEKDGLIPSCSDFSAVKETSDTPSLKADEQNQEFTVKEDSESLSSSSSIQSKIIAKESSGKVKIKSYEVIPSISGILPRLLTSECSVAAKTKNCEVPEAQGCEIIFDSASVLSKMLDSSETTKTESSPSILPSTKNDETLPSSSNVLFSEPSEASSLFEFDDLIKFNKPEDGNKSSDIPVATTSTEQELVTLSSDSEDGFEIDISGKFSPDSDIMEIDLTNEPDKKKDKEQTDSQFLANLIKECDITSTTINLRETLGTKIWTEFVIRKMKSGEFAKKFLVKLPYDKQTKNFQKSLLLEAFVKNFTQDPNFDINVLIYILLCIQKHFSASVVVDSLFTNPSYQKFIKIFFRILQNFMDKYHNRAAFYEACRIQRDVIRIREDMLWNSNQLGSATPNVLLYTVFYINTKYFSLHTVEEHESITPKGFVRYSKVKTMSDGTPVNRKFISYNYPNTDPHGRVFKQVQENALNVLKCPVQISDFYVSKCPPISGLTSNFYLLPSLGCTPESKYWFTPRRLPVGDVKNMLNLTLMVEDIRSVLEIDSK